MPRPGESNQGCYSTCRISSHGRATGTTRRDRYLRGARRRRRHGIRHRANGGARPQLGWSRARSAADHRRHPVERRGCRLPRGAVDRHRGFCFSPDQPRQYQRPATGSGGRHTGRAPVAGPTGRALEPTAGWSSGDRRGWTAVPTQEAPEMVPRLPGYDLGAAAGVGGRPGRRDLCRGPGSPPLHDGSPGRGLRDHRRRPPQDLQRGENQRAQLPISVRQRTDLDLAGELSRHCSHPRPPPPGRCRGPPLVSRGPS